MPFPKDHVPAKVELELETLFDRCLSSKTGAVHYACTKSRAAYLKRWATHMQNASALLSVRQLGPNDPSYGLGAYWNLQVHATAVGLFVEVVEKPEMTLYQAILSAAFGSKPYTIVCKTEKHANSVINRLIKLQRRLAKELGVEVEDICIERDPENRQKINLHPSLLHDRAVRELTKDDLARALQVLEKEPIDD